MQTFQGLIKNKVEFPRKSKKNSCKISRDLGFLTLKFLRDVTYTIVPNFREWSFDLPGISRSAENNKKIPGFFSKRYVLKPPCFFFLE